MPPQHQQVSLVQSPVGLLLFSPGSWCMQGFVCVLQERSPFPPVIWSPVIKSHWPSKSDSWRFPFPLLDPQAGKPDVELRRTFTTVGELLWYHCSPVCGLPTQKIWDFSFIMIVSILQSCCSFFCVFGCGVSFLVDSSVLLLMDVQQLVAILVLSQEMSAWPSTLPSWTTNLHFCQCCCCSVAQSCLTLCDPMDCSMPGLPVPYSYLLEFAQVHIHCIGDAIQPSQPLMPSHPFALNISQHQGLFQWVGCSYQMTKILELQHQSFQQIFMINFL